MQISVHGKVIEFEKKKDSVPVKVMEFEIKVSVPGKVKESGFRSKAMKKK